MPKFVVTVERRRQVEEDVTFEIEAEDEDEAEEVAGDQADYDDDLDWESDDDDGHVTSIIVRTIRRID